MLKIQHDMHEMVIPKKIHTPPIEKISCTWRGWGELFSDDSKCIRIFKRRWRGVNFLCGRGMDVFWNGPILRHSIN
jgi:hypothetical protein